MNRRPPSRRKKGMIAAAEAQRKPAHGEQLAFRVDPWTRRLVRPVLIAALATSVSVALLAVIRIVSPENAWMALVPLCFFLALEGAYTAAWLNNPDSYGVDRLVYRLTEIVLILVLVRVYSWALFGGGIPSPEEMRLYLTSPIAILTVGAFITSAFVALVAWAIAVSLGRIFAKLDVSIFELRFYRLSQAEQKGMGDDRPIQVPRDQLLSAYLGNWLTIGMGMIILAALSTFEVEQFATVSNPLDIARLGLSAAMLFALITYFLAGFWLLSHGRLLRMNARWLMDGVAKEADLERGWQRRALTLILAVAAVAAFLPIGSTLPISRILSLGIGGIAYFVGLAIQIIGTLFAATIMALTGNAEESQPPQAPDIAMPPMEDALAPPVGPTNPVVEMVFTSAFWALVIAMIIGALLFFLRERGYSLQRERIEGQWRIVAGWLRELWARLTGRVRLARRELRTRLRAAETVVDTPKEGRAAGRGFFRLGALSPRDQIRYYYLALVRRAGERGVQRSAAETPLEYVRDLKMMWPESEEEIEEMTSAFVAARYGRQPVERSAARSMKERWNQLKHRLRKPGSRKE